MKQFLAVFTGTPGEGTGMTAEQHEAGVAAWGRWMERHGDRVAPVGGPLGRTKRVTRDGVADIRNRMGAFAIVSADSHEAAAAMFEGHPHFTIFPGGGVEVMEVLPVPGS